MLGRYIIHFDGKKNIYKKIFELYTITSVINDSQKNFLHFGILRGLSDKEVSQYTGFSFYTFIELAPKISASKFLNKIKDWNKEQFKDETIHLKPVEQLYLAKATHLYEDGLIFKRDPSFVYLGLGVAILIFSLPVYHINICLPVLFNK